MHAMSKISMLYTCYSYNLEKLRIFKIAQRKRLEGIY